MFGVAIIGGGAYDCSLLYELNRYKVNAMFLEKESDVSVGTTRASSAIIHAGYDPEPGTLMARYNVEGNQITEQLCASLNILRDKIGSLVLGFSERDRATAEALYRRGAENGMPGLHIAEKEELHRMEPALSENALLALWTPSAAIISPWELVITQTEVAVQDGAKVMLDAGVTDIEKNGDVFIIETSQGPAQARLIINAVDVHTSHIVAMVDDNSSRVIPNRGECFVFSTAQGKLVSRVIFQRPTKMGEGVLVLPAVHGNLIAGPNTENVSVDNADTMSMRLHNVWQATTRSTPNISPRDSIHSFAGVHVISIQDDFIVEPSKAYEGFFSITGIKSPGLTSSLAAVRDMVQMLHRAGLELSPNPDSVSKCRVLRFKSLSPRECGEAIPRNPLYGTIVCRCETVTEGKIIDTVYHLLPPHSVDGIKRRCTPGMGRYQDGFYGPRVQAVIARELGIPESQVLLDRTGIHIILGRTKEQRKMGKQ